MKNKLNKKVNFKNMDKDRSSIVGFAIAGLALGTVAWYLFGTKEGRENFDRAVEGINDVSSKLQKKAKKKMKYAEERVREGMDSASHFAEKAKDKASEYGDKFRSEFQDATDEAKDKGSKLAQDAKDLANKAAHSTSNLADEAKSKLRDQTS